MDLYRKPEKYLINSELSEIIVHSTPTIDVNEIEGCVMNIQFQIKKIFESPGVFLETLKYIEKLKN